VLRGKDVIDQRPGLNTARLVGLVHAAVARCRIDLRGATVFTEAATGAYAVTPVLAALAGADQVYALGRSTCHGTVAEAAYQTRTLARESGVADRIEIVSEKCPDLLARSDVVTNSGHVRPIDRHTVSSMKPGSVVPLMYEKWELRPGEVDLGACRERGIHVAGTNERHPNVDVFSYLGILAVKLLADAGVANYRSRVLLVCDNPFAPFISSGLVSLGATVEANVALVSETNLGGFDAILVATKPGSEVAIGPREAAFIARRDPGAVVAQLWGEIDRAALDGAGVSYWPKVGPKPGHMSVLPSAVGPEPIVRLQAGGLKVAEVLLRGTRDSPDWEYVDAV
jgi:hypothetical protein